jgi:rfaE bifunctional protein kinase chain/domain/rfaE bifunctional protein nucleotidyltransferase chain/domain
MTLSFERKIVNREQLIRLIDGARRRSKTIVQCHGCFDIVHPGHIRYLEFARRQGDLLVVTLTGDANISKGNQRPYIPEELRAENLAALECVDLVYIDPNPTAIDILDDIRPDVYVKGREYEQSTDPRFLSESRLVERNGGRVIFSSGDVVFSSTALINAVSRSPEVEHDRLQAMCSRHDLTRSTLSQTLDKFRGLRVLVIGDTVIDRYVFCDALDIASESPMMSLKQLGSTRFVGGAAVVARHVAALGAESFLLTAVGNDEPSSLVEETLSAEGVQSHLIRCRPAVVEKTRFLVDYNKILKVQTADPVPLDSLAERRAVAVIEEQARSANAVILCDFGFGMITGGFLERVMGMLRDRVEIVTADISGPQANLLHFADADLLCPTERELRSNLNDFNRGLSSVAYALLGETQAKHLIVTLEKKGLVVFDRPTDDRNSPQWSARLLSEHLPSFCDRPLDCLGGGDALLATASLSLAAGAPLMHAAYLGNAAAALEIMQLGNVPIDAASLGQWIARRAELPSTPPPRPVPVAVPEPAVGLHSC